VNLSIPTFRSEDAEREVWPTHDSTEFVDWRTARRLTLEKQDIESRLLWKPMHLQPVFAACRVRGGAVSAALFENGLCLLSGLALTDAELERIAVIVRAQCRG
jgi:dTDP-4-amino-4,6-dideoxygalactose transaminase